LLAESSWADLTLVSVARAAKIPAAELLEVAPSKPALLASCCAGFPANWAAYRPDRESQSARDPPSMCA